MIWTLDETPLWTLMLHNISRPFVLAMGCGLWIFWSYKLITLHQQHMVSTTCLLCKPLQWCRNAHDGVSNHQFHDCLLNRLFRADQRKHQSSASLAFCEGNSLGTGEFPEQRSSNAENVFIMITSSWVIHMNRLTSVVSGLFDASVVLLPVSTDRLTVNNTCCHHYRNLHFGALWTGMTNICAPWLGLAITLRRQYHKI